MNTKPKFCSECGASLENDDRFCPICGANILDVDGSDHKTPSTKNVFNLQHPENKNKSIYDSNSSSLNSSKDFQEEEEITQQSRNTTILSSSNSLSYTFQWAIIWTIGWIPNWSYGIMNFYYHPEKIISFTISAFMGGFISGVILVKILNSKKLVLGIGTSTISVVTWILFWEILFYMERLVLIIYDIRYIIVGVFTSVLAIFTIKFLKKKYALKVTRNQIIIIAVSWAISALISMTIPNILIRLF